MAPIASVCNNNKMKKMTSEKTTETPTLSSAPLSVSSSSKLFIIHMVCLYITHIHGLIDKLLLLYAK